MVESVLTYKRRKALKDNQFGIPELRSYPLNDKSHVEQAVRMFNHVKPEYESELAQNLIKAIKKFNLDIEVGENNRFKKYYKESRVVNMASSTMEKILSGADIRSTLLESDDHKRPIELKWAIDYFERRAKDFDQSKFAKDQRKNYVTDVYHSLMCSLKPQGFDKKFYRAALTGDLAPFYANEVKVDQYCPREWRAEVIDYLVDSLTKNEQAWLDSRYEFTERDGKKFVKSFW